MLFPILIPLATHFLCAASMLPVIPASVTSALLSTDSVPGKTTPLNLDDAKKCSIVFKNMKEMQLANNLPSIKLAHHMDTTAKRVTNIDAALAQEDTILNFPEVKDAFKDAGIPTLQFVWIANRTQLALQLADLLASSGRLLISDDDLRQVSTQASTIGVPVSVADLKFVQANSEQLKKLFADADAAKGANLSFSLGHQ